MVLRYVATYTYQIKILIIFINKIYYVLTNVQVYRLLHNHKIEARFFGDGQKLYTSYEFYIIIITIS